MRIALVLLAAATVGLGTSTWLLHHGQRKLERRIAELEAPTGAPSRETAAGAQPTRGATEATRGATDAPVLEGREVAPEAVRRLETTVSDLAERLAKQETQVAEVARVVVEGTSPAVGRPEFEDAVQGVVERLLKDEGFRPQVAVAAKAGEMPKKPHIDVLSKALSLDDAQSRRFREDLQDVQGQLFTLLSEPAPDGSSWMEKIVAVEEKPESDPGRAQLFLTLMKAQVPGSDKTFLEKAVDLATEFRRRAGEYLRPDQAATFARMDVDLFGVKLD